MAKITKNDVAAVAEELKGASAEDILRHAQKHFGEKVSLANSFGAEDVALTHMLWTVRPDGHMFTLDTGRLNPETYDVFSRVQARYPTIKLRVMFPEPADIAPLVEKNGINFFYDSIDNRKACCGARKVKPLRKALSSLDAWITGLRREQSVTRTEMQAIEWDEGFGLIKYNPLIDWTEQQVWTYIRAYEVPYNELHDQSYPSIGCAPCTRAIAAGEDVRAGRWWWEDPKYKECGLHVKKPVA